mmetsp:Transcript_118184/g.220977  ORF Transcript_118184/g.220977 Transcript_118184/m.220977 type:complete len:209 (+) Transcript_118184:151-777(+)
MTWMGEIFGTNRPTYPALVTTVCALESLFRSSLVGTAWWPSALTCSRSMDFTFGLEGSTLESVRLERQSSSSGTCGKKEEANSSSAPGLYLRTASRISGSVHYRGSPSYSTITPRSRGRLHLRWSGVARCAKIKIQWRTRIASSSIGIVLVPQCLGIGIKLVSRCMTQNSAPRHHFCMLAKVSGPLVPRAAIETACRAILGRIYGQGV